MKLSVQRVFAGHRRSNSPGTIQQHDCSPNCCCRRVPVNALESMEWSRNGFATPGILAPADRPCLLAEFLLFDQSFVGNLGSIFRYPSKLRVPSKLVCLTADWEPKNGRFSA